MTSPSISRPSEGGDLTPIHKVHVLSPRTLRIPAFLASYPVLTLPEVAAATRERASAMESGGRWWHTAAFILQGAQAKLASDHKDAWAELLVGAGAELVSTDDGVRTVNLGRALALFTEGHSAAAFGGTRLYERR